MALSSFLRRRRQPTSVPGSTLSIGAPNILGRKAINDQNQQALNAAKTDLTASAPAAQANLAGQISSAEAQIPRPSQSILRPQTTQARNDLSPRRFTGTLQTTEERNAMFPGMQQARDDSARRVKSSRRSFMSPRERAFSDQQDREERTDRLTDERRTNEVAVADAAQARQLETLGAVNEQQTGILSQKNKFATSERESAQISSAEAQRIANEQQTGILSQQGRQAVDLQKSRNEQQTGILSQQGRQAVDLQKSRNEGLIGAARAKPDTFSTEVVRDINKKGNTTKTTDSVISINDRTGEQRGSIGEIIGADPVANAQAVFDDNLRGSGIGTAIFNNDFKGSDRIAQRKVRTAISAALESVFRDVQPQTIEDVQTLMEEGMGIDEAIEVISAKARAQQ